LHGGIGFSIAGEAHEAKASAATSIAIFDDDGFLDLAKLLKLLAQCPVVGMPGKTSNE